MSDPQNQTYTNLFGETVYRVPGTKGRPPFQWTEQNSRIVSMLLGLGWTNTRIAGAIRDPRTGKAISIPTLKRHFRSELAARDTARDQLNVKLLMQACEAAEGGNVGAMRFLKSLVDENDAVLKADQIREAQQAPAKKTETLGKKEKARLDAEELTGGSSDEWGSLLTPGVYN